MGKSFHWIKRLLTGKVILCLKYGNIYYVGVSPFATILMELFSNKNHVVSNQMRLVL